MRPNATKVGLFILSGMVLLVLLLAVIGQHDWWNHSTKVTLVFPEGVKGLTIGSPVYIKGVPIGEVSNIHSSFDASRHDLLSIVDCDLDFNKVQVEHGKPKQTTWSQISLATLIKQGLRAKLMLNSLLTGQLAVSLQFASQTSIRSFQMKSTYPQIPTLPSDLEQLSEVLSPQKIKTLVEHLDNTIKGIDRLVNQPQWLIMLNEIQQTVTELHHVIIDWHQRSKVLGRDLDIAISTGTTVLADTNQQMQTISQHLNKILLQAQLILNPQAPLLKELQQSLTSFDQAAAGLTEVSTLLQQQPNAVIFGKSATPGVDRP